MRMPRHKFASTVLSRGLLCVRGEAQSGKRAQDNLVMMSSLCRGCAVVVLFAASGMCATSPMGDMGGHGRHGLKKDAAAAFMQAGAFMPNLAISRGRALSHKPVQRMAPALRMSSDDKKEDVLQKLASLDSVAEKKPEPDDGDESRKGFVEEIIDWFKSDEGREEAIQWTLTFGMALSFRLFIVEPRFIPSLSMFPTFEVGDQLAVDKISKYWREYERRDVVVFRAPPAFARFVDEQKANEDLIKRIVAVEGDTVQVKGGDLYINGEKQIEPYR